MEPGMMGKIRSKVVLATASMATPAQGADWTMQDLAIDENGPCRAAYCDSGQTCIKETGICMAAATGCTPADCGASMGMGIGGSTQTCVTIMGKATCGTVLDDKFIESYPNAYADYVSLANGPSGLGVVIYDRLHGNLVGVQNAGGKWNATILDGETGTRPMAMDTGDVGIGASLAITQNGDWHVSYVNGFTESLQYLEVTAGKTALKPEVVDDGRGVNGMAFTDGQHLVGDDSSVTVDDNGTVTIVYQDATAGTLHMATGTPSGVGVHKWTVKLVDQPSRFAGFFPHRVPGDTTIANWFRATDTTMTPPSVSGDVAFVSAP
jgi:hypothetical protein